MPNEHKCACAAAPKLIFACSGAADVGEIADRAARKLTTDGAGKMFCLAGVGGRVSGIMKTVEVASALLAIDGCPIACSKHCLERAGFMGFAYLELSGLGMEKGQTPINDEHVARVATAGAARLNSINLDATCTQPKAQEGTE